MSPSDPRRWHALAVLAVAQIMVILDLTIVNVALPAIRTDLAFSADGLQWVINAYTLAFGGLLLLGGRAADLLGRRRMFLAGLGLFTVASLAGGLATSADLLIAARIVQGVGAALLSPAAFGIITVTFTDPRERSTALAIWGALAGIGGIAGVVAGGVLVDAFGWQGVFLVNLPIALAAAVATPFLVRESRTTATSRSFDVAGALLGTLGVTALVLAIIRTDAVGWGSWQVLGLFALAVVLLIDFVIVERRAASPLLPPALLGSRPLQVSCAGLALNGAAFFGMFFLAALYMQSVNGASALGAGAQFVPMGIAAIAGAVAAGTLVGRIGTRSVFAIGAAASAAGLLLLAETAGGSAYVTALLPGFVIYGAATQFVGVSNQVAAVATLPHEDAGAAGGVLTASFNIGGALGLAIITTVANGLTEDRIAGGATPADALTAGFERGLLAAAIIAAVGVVVALVAAPRLRPGTDAVADPAGAAGATQPVAA